MNYPELDLNILKVLFENKKSAVEFAQEGNSKIFSSELWRFSQYVIDYIKIYKEVPTQRVLVECFAKNNESTIKYINGVMEVLDKTPVNEKEYRHNVKKIKDRYASSLLKSIDIPQEGEVDIEKALKSLQTVSDHVKSLFTVKNFDQKTIKDAIGDFRQRYLAKARDPNFGRGILTGYNFIDFQTNGIRPQEFFVVAGESGSGKSMLLLNMAIQMWLQQNKPGQTEFTKGHNVVYFSLEMPYEQCMNRLISRLADVPYRGIRDGNLSEEDVQKLQEALKFIKKYPFEFEIVDIPRGCTSGQLELIYNDIKTKFVPEVLVVDYLGLMESDSGEDQDWLKLGKISGELFSLARTLDVVMLSAVQLNRMAGNKKEQTSSDKIGVHRIGRSAMIVQNVNIMMQIEKRDDENMHPDYILHFIKNRDGELVKGRLLKNFANSSLLNDYGDVQPDAIGNTDDIADRVQKLMNEPPAEVPTISVEGDASEEDVSDLNEEGLPF